jgi:hypothetical protein
MRKPGSEALGRGNGAQAGVAVPLEPFVSSELDET